MKVWHMKTPVIFNLLSFQRPRSFLSYSHVKYTCKNHFIFFKQQYLQLSKSYHSKIWKSVWAQWLLWGSQCIWLQATRFPKPRGQKSGWSKETATFSLAQLSFFLFCFCFLILTRRHKQTNKRDLIHCRNVLHKNKIIFFINQLVFSSL